MVAILFTFRKGVDYYESFATALVLSVNGRWFLATAGHILREVDELTNKSEYQLVGCQLVDFLGVEATHRETVPFVYKDSHPVYNDEAGFDYGIMFLSPYYENLLRANKVEALNEDIWKRPPKTSDYYFLLGIPSELVKYEPESIRLEPIMWKIEPTEKPERFQETNDYMFFGRITLDEEVNSIRGMSGGPIFGVHVGEYETRYWLIAIQSKWLPESHYIAGCSAELLGDIIQHSIDQAKHYQPDDIDPSS
jgi:hypothetical protein